jgi:ABC-type proline/glycine betaine transport system permease subunit
MARPRWETFRNVWWGLWLGISIGMFLGIWIAERPVLMSFATPLLCGIPLFMATLPDLIGHIVVNVKRFRAAARR